MTDYTKTYDGAAKDLNNAVISGADFDTEFTLISNMSQTKVDKIVPASTNNIALLGSGGNLVDGGKGIPAGSIVGTTDTQTLTNKTLTSPVLEAPTLSGDLDGNFTILGTVSFVPNALRLLDTDQSHYVSLRVSDNLTSNNNLAISTDGSNRQLNIHGNATLVTGTMVPDSRTLTAGNGMTGGGDWSANRTITLGTPGNITSTSTNAVQASSHTHALANNSVVTSKVADGAITTAKLTPPAAGSTVVCRLLGNTEVIINSATYSDPLEYAHRDIHGHISVMALGSGVITVSLQQFNGNSAGTRSVFSRVLKNGTELQEWSQTNGNDYITRTLNVSVDFADVITIQSRMGSGTGQRWRNINILSNSANLAVIPI